MKTYLATAHLSKRGNTDERKNYFLQKVFTNKVTAKKWLKKAQAKFPNNHTIAFCTWVSVKELYETIKIIKTTDLKECDTDRMKAQNMKCGYVLTEKLLMKLVTEHQKARVVGNGYKCKLIEYRLTDINFHKEVAMLEKGAYDEITLTIK